MLNLKNKHHKFSQIRDFLDLEATVALEDEEENEEDDEICKNSHTRSLQWSMNIFLGDLLDDDDEVSNDESSVISRVSIAGFGEHSLDDEARRIVARAGHNTRSVLTTTGDVALPFRVPREIDPSIWSVRVKVGVLRGLYVRLLRNDG